MYNHGEIAFVSAQELNLLLKDLAFGNVPDVVIFYDGVNDGYAGTYSPALPRQMQPYEHSIAERATPTLTQAMQQVYREAKARLSGRDADDVFFLGNILDHVSEPCYIDWIHLGPDANDIVAEQIFWRVQGKF